jgi:hypothetical protein
LIDFRYHVVSIVAVFLALTVGLVIGSSFLSKVAYDELNNQLSSLRSQNQTLHNTENALSAQVRQRDALLDALGPDAVRGKLAGESVAVVVLPGADTGVGDAMAALLAQAGATVTGEVVVKSALVDPGQAARVAAVGQTLPSFHGSRSSAALRNGSAAADALSDLASALGHRIPVAAGSPTASPTTASPKSTGATDAGTAGNAGHSGDTGTDAAGGADGAAKDTPGRLTDAEAATAVSAYAGAGLIEVKDPVMPAADLVDVIAPDPSSEASATLDDNLYLDFVRDLDGIGKGALIEGTAAAATAPGLLAAALEDGWTQRNVSTVDSADLSAGRIAAVYALAEEAGGKTGHYGLTGSPDGPLPDLR